jgi:pentatricopeptide repeat protein
VYSTVLKGLATAKDIEKVFTAYQEMQERSMECNTITYNTLLDACAKCNAMCRVPSLLEDMRKTNTEPDLITYSTLIKGYCLEGSIDKGFRVLEEMRADGKFQADEIMYNSLLDGCAKQQRVEEALKVLKEMEASGTVKPSNHTVSILVKLLGRARRLSQAFEIVEDMSTRYGFRLNVQVYTCLMQACIFNKRLDRALALHDTMVKERCSPDERLYVALVRGCLQNHAPRKAADVVRAAFQLPGGSLTVSGGRTAGVDEGTVEEVCKALQMGKAEDKATCTSLRADLESRRKEGRTSAPSYKQNGSGGRAAPWSRGQR